jgi:CRP-like cAMP-binding protein
MLVDDAGDGGFDLGRFLQSARRSRRSVRYEPVQVIFSQGAPCTSVLYVQRGVVKLSLLSPAGQPRNIRIEEDLVDRFVQLE